MIEARRKGHCCTRRLVFNRVLLRNAHVKGT
jgi:hypothetical protein